MNRNQLMLTDKDTAAYKPIFNTIMNIATFAQSELMFCLFHALAKMFEELGFPHLPHDKSGKERQR